MKEQMCADRVRLFAGIELTRDVREYARGVTDRLSEGVGEVRWVPARNMHVTLKFFGLCEPGLIPRLAGVMMEASALLPLELNVGGTGGFPSQGSARVIWVRALDTSGRLSEVHGVIERGARRLGVEKERRAYSPHITIGRARKRPVRIPDDILDEETGPLVLDVSELVLFESVLKSTGAEYQVLRRVSP